MTDGFSVVGFESSSPGIVLLQGGLRYINDRKLIRDRPWKTGQLLNVFRNPGEAATTVLAEKAGYRYPSAVSNGMPFPKRAGICKSIVHG